MHSPSHSTPVKRSSTWTRRSLVGALGLGGAAALGVPLYNAFGSRDASNVSAHTTEETLLGPGGVLLTDVDIERMRALIEAGDERVLGGLDRLVANGASDAGYVPRPVEELVRGGEGQNYANLFRDVAAAHQNALRWHATQDEAHAEASARILNAWSSTLRTVTGNADRFLASGLYGFQLAAAGGLMDGHDAFDKQALATTLTEIFAPMCEDFLENHNNAVITNYWANWDLCNMSALLAIGVFAERDDLYDRAIDYFWNGEGNGSLENAIPFVLDDELAQWQESGRDQGHTLMGIRLMGDFMQVAWSQGTDLFVAGDERFRKAAEYVARYNLGHDVPFEPYAWQSGPADQPPHVGWNEHTVISEHARGQHRPIWALLEAHYAGRLGRSVPHISEMAALVAPEGGGGDHSDSSGGYDNLGFGTLVYTDLT